MIQIASLEDAHATVPVFLLALLFVVNAGAVTLKDADKLRRQKKYDEARQAYLEIGSQSTDSAQIYLSKFRAAQCLIDKKDYKSFANEAGALLNEIPPVFSNLRAEVELTSASLLITNHRWKSAEARMAAFAAAHPGTIYAARAQAYQAEALGKQKKYDPAREVFFKIARECGDTTLALEARHQAANLLFDAKKYDNFEKEASALMAENPPHSNSYVALTKFNLAKNPDAQGRPLESARRFEALTAENPSRNHYEHHIGEFYLNAAYRLIGKPEEAELYFAKGREYMKKERQLIDNRIASKKLKSDDYHARFTYLQTYFLEKDLSGLADQALKLSAEYPKPSKLWAAGMLWYGISKYCKSPRDYDGAAAVFDEVLEANVVDTDISGHLPTQIAIWRATIAAEQKDDKALSTALEALKKMPKGPLRKEGLKRFSTTAK